MLWLMTRIEGKTMTREDINLDDMEFVNCKFKRCRFTYSGAACILQLCDFEGECAFVFTGAAKNTGSVLRALGWTPPVGREKIM
jgi:hypothetical protein